MEKKKTRRLIDDLQALGKLIDPESRPKSGPATASSLEDTPARNMQSISTSATTPTRSLDQTPTRSSPTMSNQTPFPTIDMFGSTLEKELVSRRHGTPDTLLPPDDTPRAPLSEIEPDNSPTEELARELIGLIERQVSARTGEELDDTLRDELIVLVMNHIENWQHSS